MSKLLMQITGLAQTALGGLGVGNVGGMSSAIGSQSNGDVFNLLSGAALSYFGFGGTPSLQKIGIPTISGLNGIVGLLGLAGINNIAGIQLSEGVLANLINILVSVLGFASMFFNKGK